MLLPEALVVPLVALLALIVVVVVFAVRHIPESLTWLKKHHKAQRAAKRRALAMVPTVPHVAPQSVTNVSIPAPPPLLRPTSSVSAAVPPLLLLDGGPLRPVVSPPRPSPSKSSSSSSSSTVVAAAKQLSPLPPTPQPPQQQKPAVVQPNKNSKRSTSYPAAIASGIRSSAKAAAELAVKGQVLARSHDPTQRRAAVLVLERAIAMFNTLTAVFPPTDIDHIRMTPPGAPSTLQLVQLLVQQQQRIASSMEKRSNVEEEAPAKASKYEPTDAPQAVTPTPTTTTRANAARQEGNRTPGALGPILGDLLPSGLNAATSAQTLDVAAVHQQLARLLGPVTAAPSGQPEGEPKEEEAEEDTAPELQEENEPDSPQHRSSSTYDDSHHITYTYPSHPTSLENNDDNNNDNSQEYTQEGRNDEEDGRATTSSFADEGEDTIPPYLRDMQQQLDRM